MKALAQQIVERLVDNPKDVIVKEERQKAVTKITIEVNPNNVGQVIGKSGKTISALRILFTAISVKENKRLVDVIIIEPR